MSLTLEQYFERRGFVPTLVSQETILSMTYSLYIVIDDYLLSHKPEELQQVMVSSYTYYCIFVSDQDNRPKRIYPYLPEDEAKELYAELTHKAHEKAKDKQKF